MSESSAPWVDGLTIGALLRRAAEVHPEREALVFPALDRGGHPRERGGESEKAAEACYRATYADLDRQVDEIARALTGLGLKKGDHVAVWATNWPRWVLLQFATARIGTVMVTVNPSYRSSELAYVLRQSDAKALFLIDRFRTSDYIALLNKAVSDLARSAPGQLESADFPHLRHIVSLKDAEPAPGLWSWDAFLNGAASVDTDELRNRESALQPHDPINIQYTSGTTGFPKGAMLSHRNLLLNAYHVGSCQRLTEGDRICAPVPFYHCFGCVLGVLCAAVHGATLVVPAEHFHAEATLDAIERERATAIYGVPTMFISQLQHPSYAGRDLASLRTGIMAGSPCPVELMKRVVNEMGAVEITIAYGQTEASPVITQTRTEDPIELRVQTVGRPLPGVEVKVVNPSTGETLGDEQQGELCARGHVVMLGYYNMPEATDETIDADGWLHTGDLALRRPDSYYKITGRIKEMICRGGENIYPREIEEVLYTHPAVEQAAVLGVPDPKFVEEVCAWIRLKDGATASEEEIRRFCREHIAHYKTPKHVRFVDEFPQTVTGKIRKFKIRETMVAELGLEETETA